MKASHTIRPVFDDPNLVSAAGLVPAMLLAESAGLHDLLAEQVSVASPNAAVKAASVVGGMLAGADSIDDLDVLRHAVEVFSQLYVDHIVLEESVAYPAVSPLVQGQATAEAMRQEIEQRRSVRAQLKG